MSLAKKLNLKDTSSLRILHKPTSVQLDDVSSDAKAEGVIVFVTKSKDLSKAKPAFEAAREDKIAWIAYPKAGQLGTDLNRDILWTEVGKLDPKIKPVRQVALDDVWSALRFRPA